MTVMQQEQGTIHICMVDEVVAGDWYEINAKEEDDINLDIGSKRTEQSLKEKWKMREFQPLKS